MRYTIKQARSASQIKKYASVARIVRYQRAFNKYAYAYKLAAGPGAPQAPASKPKDLSLVDTDPMSVNTGVSNPYTGAMPSRSISEPGMPLKAVRRDIEEQYPEWEHVAFKNTHDWSGYPRNMPPAQKGWNMLMHTFHVPNSKFYYPKSKYEEVVPRVRSENELRKGGSFRKSAGKDDGILDNIKDFTYRDYANAAEHPVLAGTMGAGAGSAAGYIVDLLKAIRKARKGEKYSLAPGSATLLGAGLGAGVGVTPAIITDIAASKAEG